MNINRENLKKLADGLRGRLRIMFDMEMWVKGLRHGFEEDVTDVSECGTTACAMGHATYLVAPKRFTEDWSMYGERVFGVVNGTDEWFWMFGPRWADRVWNAHSQFFGKGVDNTPAGAADRIDWFLDHGLPENWEDQMRGKAPLCYRKDPTINPPLPGNSDGPQ